jgi:DNA-directed RNA polymerase subunit K
MNQKVQEQFTRFEIARIIGARALQIAMDAPILLKLSKEDLEKLDYNALRIAEKELDEGALPISVHRPSPRKARSNLGVVKEESISDEELVEKEQEVEKEIVEDAAELGFANEDDMEEEVFGDSSSEKEEQ